MLAKGRCGVCDELHLLTRDGVMSVHSDATGARCAGSVGRAPHHRSGNRPARERSDDAPKLRLERNQAPYSKQWVGCDQCGMRVPVSIYGKLAGHRVYRPGVTPSKKARLCAGSGRSVPESDLRFDVATPPKVTSRVSSPRAVRRRVECPRCGTVLSVQGDGPLPAHQRPSHRWCAEGAPPTEAERAKAARSRRRKGSVWAVRGGLPTLGQGR